MDVGRKGEFVMCPMRVDRPAVVWGLAPLLGIGAVWLVTFIGIVIGNFAESIAGITLFFEASFAFPVVFGSPSGAIIAGLGAAYGRSSKVTFVAILINSIYFFVVACISASGVAQYHASGAGVFLWELIVGVVGGVAAAKVGTAFSQDTSP